MWKKILVVLTWVNKFSWLLSPLLFPGGAVLTYMIILSFYLSIINLLVMTIQETNNLPIILIKYQKA